MPDDSLFRRSFGNVLTIDGRKALGKGTAGEAPRDWPPKDAKSAKKESAQTRFAADFEPETPASHAPLAADVRVRDGCIHLRLRGLQVSKTSKCPAAREPSRL
jgi:hypothetical protein